MEDPSFVDILADLGSAFLTLPLIATLSQVAIAKAFCKLQFYSYSSTVTVLQLQFYRYSFTVTVTIARIFYNLNFFYYVIIFDKLTSRVPLNSTTDNDIIEIIKSVAGSFSKSRFQNMAYSMKK